MKEASDIDLVSATINVSRYARAHTHASRKKVKCGPRMCHADRLFIHPASVDSSAVSGNVRRENGSAAVLLFVVV